MTEEKRNSFKRQEAESPKTATRSQMRSSHREQRKRNTETEEAEPKKLFWVQIRILPIWLRVLLVLVLLAGAAILGAMVGYGYIGDGEPADVLQRETWIHILNIINGKES